MVVAEQTDGGVGTPPVVVGSDLPAVAPDVAVNPTAMLLPEDTPLAALAASVWPVSTHPVSAVASVSSVPAGASDPAVATETPVPTNTTAATVSSDPPGYANAAVQPGAPEPPVPVLPANFSGRTTVVPGPCGPVFVPREPPTGPPRGPPEQPGQEGPQQQQDEEPRVAAADSAANTTGEVSNLHDYGSRLVR